MENAVSMPLPATATVPRDFSKLWASSIASSLGDRLQSMAMLALAIALTGKDNAGALLVTTSALFAVPFLLCAPFAGILVDRVSRQRLMIVSCVVRGILTLSLAALPALGLPFAASYPIVLLLGASSALFSPARDSLLPDVVSRERLLRANSFLAATSMLAILGGIALGGYLVDTLAGDPGRIFFLVAGVFCASAFFASLFARTDLRGGRQSTLSWRQATLDFKTGIVFLVRKSLVRDLAVLSCLFWVLSGAVYSGIMLGRDLHNLSGGEMAQLICHAGAGLSLGAFALSLLDRSIPRAFPHQLGFFLIAGALLFIAHAQDFPAHRLGMFFLGASGILLMAPVQASLQRMVPEGVRGKVFGALATLTMLSYLLSMKGTQLAIELWGLKTVESWAAVFAFGLGCIVFYRRHVITRNLYYIAACLLRPFLRVYFKLRANGKVELPQGRPVIVAANHSSYLDAVLISATFPRRVSWMMIHAHYDRAPHFFRNVGAVRVAGDGSDKEALKQCLHTLKRKDVVGLFPEGHLSLDGTIDEHVENGIGYMVAKTGAVVVPAAIDGAFEAWPKGRRWFRRSRIRLRYGATLDFTDLIATQGRRSAQAITERIMSDIKLLKKQLEDERERPER